MDSRFATSTELIGGGGGVFDVRVNGDLAYSKHQCGDFPDEDTLIEEIASKYA